jgi:hypothetical protein
LQLHLAAKHTGLDKEKTGLVFSYYLSEAKSKHDKLVLKAMTNLLLCHILQQCPSKDDKKIFISVI